MVNIAARGTQIGMTIVPIKGHTIEVATLVGTGAIQMHPDPAPAQVMVPGIAITRDGTSETAIAVSIGERCQTAYGTAPWLLCL